MFTEIIRKGSRHKLRDINIAIDYRSGLTLENVGEKYGINRESVRKIHAVQLRLILIQLGKNRENCHLRCNFHSDDLDYLKAYKDFLLAHLRDD